MTENAQNRSITPFIIGGLCVVLVVLVWQVIPRQPAGLAKEDIPTTLEEATPAGSGSFCCGKGERSQSHGGHSRTQGFGPKEIRQMWMPSSNWDGFSIQSGQIDKAKERFVQAIELAPRSRRTSGSIGHAGIGRRKRC